MIRGGACGKYVEHGCGILFDIPQADILPDVRVVDGLQNMFARDFVDECLFGVYFVMVIRVSLRYFGWQDIVCVVSILFRAHDFNGLDRIVAVQSVEVLFVHTQFSGKDDFLHIFHCVEGVYDRASGVSGVVQGQARLIGVMSAWQ